MVLPNKNVIELLGVIHVSAALALYAAGHIASVDLYLRAAGMLTAHALAAALCIAIALDYPAGSPLRRSWVLFAGEPLSMGTRALIHLTTGTAPNELANLLIPVGSTFMIAGMVATGYALRRMGLTFHLYRRDVAAMLFIASVLPAVIVQRWGWPPALDWAAGAPITIFLTAIVSIPLVRFSRQMENALLARTYVCIVIYMAVRCLFHLLSAMQVSGFSAGEPVVVLRYIIGYGAAWIFAYAAALRYAPVREANRELINLSRLRRAVAPVR